MRVDSPCRKSPDLWFGSHVQQSVAIHICLDHCSRLIECRGEPPAIGGVIAGIAYGHEGAPLQAHKQPRPTRCRGCGGTSDTGACGTVRGFTRHRRRGEKACDPCRLAHNARALEWLHAKKARLAEAGVA